MECEVEKMARLIGKSTAVFDGITMEFTYRMMIVGENTMYGVMHMHTVAHGYPVNIWRSVALTRLQAEIEDESAKVKAETLQAELEQQMQEQIDQVHAEIDAEVARVRAETLQAEHERQMQEHIDQVHAEIDANMAEIDAEVARMRADSDASEDGELAEDKTDNP